MAFEAIEPGWAEVWDRLSKQFPHIDRQIALGVLVDARHNVELFGKTAADRFASAERIARSELASMSDRTSAGRYDPRPWE